MTSPFKKPQVVTENLRISKMLRATLWSSLSMIPAVLIMVALSGDFPDHYMSAMAVFVVAMIASAIAFFFICLIGIPLHLALTYRRITSVIPYVSVGFLVPTCWIFLPNLMGQALDYSSLITGLSIVLCGPWAAFVFWLLAVGRARMDNS